MKKIIFIIAPILILCMFTYSYCYATRKIDTSRMVYVSLRHKCIDNTTQRFDWFVENRSISKNKLTFKNGLIINYEIMDHRSGYKYVTKRNDTSTVILKNGENYHTTIDFDNLDKGHYSAKFWAVSDEGNEAAMEISFDVD